MGHIIRGSKYKSPAETTNLLSHYMADGISGYTNNDYLDDWLDESDNNNDIEDVIVPFSVLGNRKSQSLDVSGKNTQTNGAHVDRLFGTFIWFTTNDAILYVGRAWTQWDLASVTLDYGSSFNNYDCSGEDTLPVSMSFSESDNESFYVVGQQNASIYNYSTQSSYRFRNVSLIYTLDVSEQDNTPRQHWFNADGTKLFFVGSENGAVYEYALSVAWDISTATYTDSFTVSSQDADPRGLTFNADGTKMYINGYTNKRVYEYSLSVAWDISTASYDSISGDYSDTDNQTYSINMGNNNKYIFTYGTGNTSIYRYSFESRPTYVTDVQNGLPAVNFDDAEIQTLQLTSNLNLGDRYTIMIAMRPESTDSDQLYPIIYSDDVDTNYLMSYNGDAMYHKPQDGSSANVRPLNISFGNNTILTIRRNGSVIQAFEYFANLDTTTFTNLSDTDAFFRGLGTLLGSRVFKGYIFEVLVRSDYKDQTTIVDMVSYLKSKRDI